jgi:glucokinase
MARRLGAGPRLNAVAVGFPGPVTPAGDALAAPTLWPGEPPGRFALGAALETLWPGAQVLVLNDLTAAGYAYAAAHGPQFCLVNVSSGIGNKVFIDGEPLVGRRGVGGEIGHVVVDRSPDAPVCDCGVRGDLAALASGRGALRMARQRAQLDPSRYARSQPGERTRGDPGSLTNEILAAGFRAADPWTLEALRPGAAALGSTLALVAAAVGVDRFVLLGGFARALGERYRGEVAAAAASGSSLVPQTWDTNVLLGTLGDDAGLLGAARRLVAVVGAG